VDSSTALRELSRDSSNEITAYYLKVWLEDELKDLGECPWEEDLHYARAVCEMAGVPLTVVPLQLEYYERVVSYALEELRAGRTPSPDIFCNERIKFGAFLDYLRGAGSSGSTAAGATAGPGVAGNPRPGEAGGSGPGHGAAAPGPRIATGHYAQLVDAGDHVELHRSPDPVKDQTYFLAHLSQEQLRHVAFPIGGFTKEEVRRRAHEYLLPNRDRPDSQGICFLGKVRYPEFIRHYLGERAGEIVEHETGRTLGEHRGYWFYTIGQRQGLGLGGGPWYVVAKDTERNEVRVSHAEGVADQARSEFVARELSWTWEPPEEGEVLVKIRHGPSLTPGTIRWAETDALRVMMETPDRGVAPGQFAVFYRGEMCLGCGKIAEE
jgi:tRNA-specific 2-thiouridylase